MLGLWQMELVFVKIIIKMLAIPVYFVIEQIGIELEMEVTNLVYVLQILLWLVVNANVILDMWILLLNKMDKQI
jgi:hypothetical protein